MNSALNYWNLMVSTLTPSSCSTSAKVSPQAYDYAGSWLTWADNQANVYGGTRTNVSTDGALKWYAANGATANKITLGIPLYGRAFENTAGIGASYSGVSITGSVLWPGHGLNQIGSQIGPGSVEAGVYSYKFLPIAGATVIENLTDVTSYSYDSAKQELVSYDSPHIATVKAQYVQSKGLAGAMFWEVSVAARDVWR